MRIISTVAKGSIGLGIAFPLAIFVFATTRGLLATFLRSRPWRSRAWSSRSSAS